MHDRQDMILIILRLAILYILLKGVPLPAEAFPSP